MRGLTHILRTATFAIALPLLAPGLVTGASYVDLADDELVDRTPVIVIGRITDAASAPGPAIDYQVVVEQIIRGSAPDRLTVRLPGGVRHGLGLAIPGVPELRPEERVVLFLRPDKGDHFVLSHLFLGAFGIVTSADGEELAIQKGEGHAVRLDDTPGNETSNETNKAEPIKTDMADHVRHLDRFVSWLADRSRGEFRAPDYRLPSQIEKHTYGKAETHKADKWERVFSSTEPEPFGCGATGGNPVRWFHFNLGNAAGWRTHFAGQEGLADGGMGQFRTALDTWTDDPNSNIDLRFLGLTDSDIGFAGLDGLNTILFGDPRDQIPGTVEDAGLLALGGPWFLCELREFQGQLYHPIIEADIVTQEGLEIFFAASPDPRGAAEEIFAHELGHTLGFAHTPDPQALMFAIAHDDGRGAALDVDDLGGAYGLYGIGPLPMPPTAPAGLEVPGLFATSAQLTWHDLSNDESNFRLERRLGLGEYVPIAAVTADRETYFDTGLLPETTYSYRIRAQNAAGASDYSGEVTVTTPEDPRPAAPTNLRAAPLSSHRIRLTWQDNSDDETSFALFLFDSQSETFVEIPYTIPANTTSVLLVDLQPNVRYTLQVRARNRFGTSPPSNTAIATSYEDDSRCLSSQSELCLLGGRFKVELKYVTPALPDGVTGVESSATAIPNTDQNGMFWFFDPGNVEFVVKMLDGTGVNGHFWVFYGGISDLELTLQITDMVTGQTVQYDSPRGEICGGADITAFVAEDAGEPVTAPAAKIAEPTVEDLSRVRILATVEKKEAPKSDPQEAPEPSKFMSSVWSDNGPCTPGTHNLCLLDGRLRVEVDWRNPHDGGSEGEGRAVVLSDESGYFWFFAPENLELVVKTLDGGNLNGHLWVFYGALTDLEYWITVTDTANGNQRVYYNPPGELCGDADILAFDLDP